MNKIVVRLVDAYSSLEEDFEFKVGIEELMSKDDLSQRNIDKSEVIEVEYSDDIYYVWEETIKEIDERHV